MESRTGSGRRRARRKPGEVRELLVSAAREAFVNTGYQGASLRQIAINAGTTQAILYRYFPSKVELFAESVLRPFEDFVAELVGQWNHKTASELPTPDLIAGFTRALYEFSCKHRGLIMTLLAADVHGTDSVGETKTAFAHSIGTVVSRAMADATTRGWSDIDVEVAVPATMAMIVSTAMLDDWLFPSADKPGSERILAELIRYEMRAITGL